MDKQQNHNIEPANTPTVKCRHCRDKGYTYDPGNIHYRGIGVLPREYCKSCELGKMMYEEWLASPEAKAQIAHVFAKDYLESQKQSMIPPKFRDFSLAHLNKNPGLFDIIQSYLDAWPTPNRHSLYLWWNIGAGKTTTAIIAANELISRYWVDCLFMNWATWLALVKESFDTKQWTGKNLLERMRKCTLLVIDDIHQEKGSDWVREQLFILINYRYEQGLPVIITSNYAIEDMEERYSGQVASRIIETSKIVEFSGEDRRKEQRSIF